jgi:predicted HNH restriction endonuclease
VFASHVHHKKPLAQCTPPERTDPENLMSVCPPCHNIVEAEASRAGRP